MSSVGHLQHISSCRFVAGSGNGISNKHWLVFDARSTATVLKWKYNFSLIFHSRGVYEPDANVCVLQL
jgi:hypothetical protein